MVYDNDTAQMYIKVKQSPLNESVIDYTLFNLIGNLTDKSVLELGCGSGYYTRQFKQRGAKRVVGVDIFVHILKLAQQEKVRKPLGIEYLVHDVCELGELGCFDLVASSFLLNHASTTEQLVKMCRCASINLKTGGHFLSLNNNVEQAPESYHICKQFGYTKSISEPVQEGAPITLTFTISAHEKFSVTDYYFSKATYEWAFRNAGFTEIHWHPLTVSPEAMQKFGQTYWQDVFDHPPVVGIEGFK